MKILIDSHNTIHQNISGGLRTRINNHVSALESLGIECKRYNKWTDNIKDFDILHIFKLSLDTMSEINYAKQIGIPIVLSSVYPISGAIKIKASHVLSKYLKIRTGYDFQQKMLEKASIVTTETAKEKKFLCNNYGIPFEKVEAIPNGVSIDIKEKYRNVIYEMIPELQGTDYILQVGRFDRNKNQLSVIKALKDEEIPVLFVGGPDPSEMKYYQECIKNASSNMYFTGWLKTDSPALQSAYANAKAFILPSFAESFGISIFEAGIAGANLIVSNVVPIKEWGIESFCYQVNPKSINEIREKCILALNTPQRKDQVEILANKFNWKNIAQRYIEIYARVINEK